ncbi:serine/threonine protein kinase [Streptomyces armeniacus]|uniref:non-specific serine/threonine protein kinase n=1 Tax=Streptomyces armeniacus TaxID=83291 RepID=A0A345XLV8_9ACTN|nr:PASTA domain-containing protein [Streptomyces armeniacus]AXK32624.1 serine/threonine protein kinase [Streptomyces armeniacus]
MDTTLHDPLVGQRLDGRYRVDARIAVGGMATVYRAVDTRLDRVLALKVMHTSLAADGVFVERFIREAKSAAKLAHPNVVAVFDQGTDGTYVYLAMEYVAGCTLRDVLRDRGALRPRVALDVLEPMLAALGAAHRAGLVHRDMKPENVLIGDDGSVKVADFGLVRTADGQTTSSTGSIMGTVSYLAPEQIEEGTADARADLYACGVLLYEMLTGAKPHAPGTPAQVIYQHLHEGIPTPSRSVPGLARQLDELVARATARAPGDRPDDAVALLAEVRTMRATLSDEELDAVPPRARTDADEGAEHLTSVLSRRVSQGAVAPPAAGAAAGAGAGAGASSDTPQDAVPGRVPEGRAPAAEPEPPVRDGIPAQAGAPPVRAETPDRDTTQLAALPHAEAAEPPAGSAPAEHAPPGANAAPGAASGIPYTPSPYARAHALPDPDAEPRTDADADSPADGAGGTRDATGLRRWLPRRTLLILAAVLLVLLAGGGAWYFAAGQYTKTPAVLDMTEAKARDTLEKAGLDVDVQRDYSLRVKRGRVIESSPGPGERVGGTDAVTIVVSRGPEIVKVPDLSDQPLAKARAKLRDVGLEPGLISREFDAQTAQGSVIRTEPDTGTGKRPGSAVALTVSKGQAIQVPDLIGDEEKSARDVLEALGLKVRIAKERVFSDEEAGTIAKQSSSEGAPVAKGDTITLTLSKGQDMVAVPDVGDMTADKARQTLEGAGFTVDVRKVFVSDRVFNQAPDAGDNAPRGSEITIWVR